MLRYVAMIAGFLLFCLLFTFGLMNSEPVKLRFYFDYVWSPPLVLVLLLFFVAGAALGVLVSLLRIYRQRREIVQLKRELRLRPRAET